ncbi:hypothetical protein FALBO_1413 [Fusarium albosuccineum]|uniref:Uncharacterized protein n=1 Tax=Fusarium albosuccineum TaxID=1237068 RepID=A0A8H4PGB7_9HYPO|nr:hypothetical protein FALBO_1413 [Fusarium albosuccineum]
MTTPVDPPAGWPPCQGTTEQEIVWFNRFIKRWNNWAKDEFPQDEEVWKDLVHRLKKTDSCSAIYRHSIGRTSIEEMTWGHVVAAIILWKEKNLRCAFWKKAQIKFPQSNVTKTRYNEDGPVVRDLIIPGLVTVSQTNNAVPSPTPPASDEPQNAKEPIKLEIQDSPTPPTNATAPEATAQGSSTHTASNINASTAPDNPPSRGEEISGPLAVTSGQSTNADLGLLQSIEESPMINTGPQRNLKRKFGDDLVSSGPGNQLMPFPGLATPSSIGQSAGTPNKRSSASVNNITNSSQLFRIDSQQGGFATMPKNTPNKGALFGTQPGTATGTGFKPVGLEAPPDITKLKQEIAMLVQKNFNMEMEISRLQARDAMVEALQRKNDELEQKNTQLDQDVASLRLMHEHLRSSNGSLEQQVQGLTTLLGRVLVHVQAVNSEQVNDLLERFGLRVT